MTEDDLAGKVAELRRTQAVICRVLLRTTDLLEVLKPLVLHTTEILIDRPEAEAMQEARDQEAEEATSTRKRRGEVAEYSSVCAEGAWVRIVPLGEGFDLEAFVGHDIVFTVDPPSSGRHRP